MLPSAFHRLLCVAATIRGADQLALAGVPLIAATMFQAGPDLVGVIVAAQGAAWLLVSLPAGVMVDRISPLAAMRRTTLVVLGGSLIALFGFVMDALLIFAFGAFVTASAAVIGFLAEGASVQRLISAAHLPRANGRLQMVQSAAMLLGPAIAGLLVAFSASAVVFALTAGLGVIGFLIALGFVAQNPPQVRHRAPRAEIAEGFRFVLGEPLLVGIVACALFWNTAFFALLAQFVPFALQRVALTPAEVGFAQATMGVGSVVAALTVAPILARVPPRVVLLFGPASSTLAAVLVACAPSFGGMALPTLGFFLLGYGPILWFVCQNTIRQLVTPMGLLGRVGSVIQVAIYGVRALGALLGGFVAARYGFEVGLGLVIGLFALSTGAVVASALIRLHILPAARG